MAELTEVRCYECFERIPEGQIVRGDVLISEGGEVSTSSRQIHFVSLNPPTYLPAGSCLSEIRVWHRESFCTACSEKLEHAAKVERERHETELQHMRIGFAIMGLVVLGIVGTVQVGRWLIEYLGPP